MSSLTAANVGSSLDFTFARFVDCMMIEIRGNFTAICAGFVGQEDKRSIFTVRGVICAIRKTLGARTGASRKVRDQTVPFAWKICILLQFLARFSDVVICCIRPVSKHV